LLFKNAAYPAPLTKPDVTFTPVDDSNIQITAAFSTIPAIHDHVPLLAIVGGKVYGYADAPIQRDGNKLTFTSPGDDLLCGTAKSYDVRTSDSPITPASFADAFAVAPPPRAAAPKGTVLRLL